MRTLIDVFWSLRPINAAMAAMMVFASYKIASMGCAITPSVIILSLATVLMGGAQAVFNDVMDVNVDRAQKSHRAIAAGRLDKRIMLIVSFLTMLLSVAAAAAVNFPAVIFFVVGGGLFIVYSAWAKYRCGVLGTLMTSAVTSALCFTGCLVANNWSRPLAIALAVFSATMAREIAKDVEDLPGDLGHRERTLPMLIGSQRSMAVAVTFAITMVLTSYAPILTGQLGSNYCVLITITNMALVCLVFARGLYQDRQARVLQLVLKISMVAYLLAYLFD